VSVAPLAGLSATDVVGLLELAAHPEGGFYRETFRDPHSIDGRAASTCIYFLLPAGVVSRWHRVDAVETWHWYAGAALDLRIAADGTHFRCHRLGPDLAGGERPQAVVPFLHWQQAVSLGAWTLVGCTVAPGFRFEGFTIAGADFAPIRG
jgi:uncharacterized protein